MARVHDITRFRATALVTRWGEITRDWAPEHLPSGRLGEHTRLVWACGEDLGVPLAPFTVWFSERSKVPTRRVSFETRETNEGVVVTWGETVAGRVALVCDVRRDTEVGAFALRHGITARTAVNVVIMETNASTRVVLDVSASEITSVLLVNATAVEVTIQALDDIINADTWEKWEIVGLPVDGAYGRYETMKQGLVRNLGLPADAAMQRLRRAAPPVGWWPITESGHLAPPWSAPNSADLVKDVTKNLLPEVEALFKDGLAEHMQWTVVDERVVASPSQGARVSTQPATSRTRPLGTLMLAGLSDPFTNLACGFGTGYDIESLPTVMVPGPPTHVQKGIPDLMVTADYRDSVLGSDVQVCAYIPGSAVMGHTVVPPVLDLAVSRAALVPPESRDMPFSQSIDINWLGRQATPWLTDPTASALARFTPASAQPAVDVLDPRPAGGSRTSVIASPEGVANRPGSDRPRMMDPHVDVPLAGSRNHGYAVAQSNVFGVFSPWQDVMLTTSAPSVNGARVVSLGLQAVYTATSVCSSVVSLEVAIEWMERSPVSLEVVTLFYPMPRGDTAPPDVGPTDAGPSGSIRSVRTLAFSGDVASVAGVRVEPLGQDGGVATSFGSASQGDAGRRYRLTFAGASLDYSANSRWGVRVWLRLKAGAVPTWSKYTPAAQSPATAVAASPVPVTPQPPPKVPGVPMGSTPDASGQSHVRVAWEPITAPGVHRVVVWEATETAMLWKLEGPARNPGDTPGDRLTTLRNAYDDVEDPHPDQGAAGVKGRIGAKRQSCFRRVMEVDPAAGSADVALPRGSRDIHLFLVTAITTTAVESDWPSSGMGSVPSDHLQPVMAPELLRPSPPAVRPAVQPDGAVKLTCRAGSPIAVQAFEVFATRSELAARDHLTMGLPRTRMNATQSTDVDRITRDPLWEATSVEALPEHWDPWFVRAVAVPVMSVPTRAQRGLTSQASDLLKVQVTPSAGPSLQNLSHSVESADRRQILVTSATTSPEHLVAAGEHRMKLIIDGNEESFALHAIHGNGPGSAPSDGRPRLVRGARSGGRTPLYLWVQRARAVDVVEVSLGLTDPLGRTTTVSLTVDAWMEPVSTPVVKVLDVFTISGRGTILVVRTDAEVGDRPPWSVTVKASGRSLRDPFPGGGRPPRPPFGERIPDRWDRRPDARPDAVSGTWLLKDLRMGALAGRRSRTVEVVRVPGAADGTNLQIFIPSAPTTVEVVIHSQRGRGEATWSRPR